MIVTGYHGTSLETARKIVREQKFNFSTKTNEWLGTGVYFFVNKEDTTWWNRSKIRAGAYTQAAVLSSIISCDDDEYIDLDIKEEKRRFDNCLMPVLDKIKNDPGHPNFKNLDELRCFSCNYFRKLNPKIKVMARTFPKLNRNIEYDSFGFPSVIENRQICVSDISCISDTIIETKGWNYAL